LTFVDDSFTNQKLSKFQMAPLLKGQRLFQLLLGQQPTFDQNLS